MLKKLIPQKVKNYFHLLKAVTANLRYQFPSHKIRLIGITGTDGKTTTTCLTDAILKAGGYQTGNINTVFSEIGEEKYDTGLHVTTPNPFQVQKFLHRMVEKKLDYAILEVTSHALDQHRVWGCAFDVAVITNVSGDHLDYHKDFENYLECKALLFKKVDQRLKKKLPYGDKGAILNRDDNSFEKLNQITLPQKINYSIEQKRDVWAEEIDYKNNRTKFVLVTPQGKINIQSPLVGEFNVYNALAAASVGISQNIPLPKIKQGIENFEGVPGRMQHINQGQKFQVILDFAHTPDSLKKALSGVRDFREKGRIICVFGCAGLRDPSRRKMGAIAARLADIVVLTAEDPRTEKLADINEEIFSYAKGEGGVLLKNTLVTPTLKEEIKQLHQENQTPFFHFDEEAPQGRKDAIRFAFDLAEPDDLVFITGKGPEKSLCFGEKEYEWDDRTTIEQLLKNYQ